MNIKYGLAMVITLSLFSGCTSTTRLQPANQDMTTLAKIHPSKQIQLASERLPLEPLSVHHRIYIFNETPILR